MNEIGVHGFTMSRIHRAAWNCNPEITLKITLNHVKSRYITFHPGQPNHVSMKNPADGYWPAGIAVSQWQVNSRKHTTTRLILLDQQKQIISKRGC